MTKLYVGNLPYTSTNQTLGDLFAVHGKVISAEIIMDRYSGRSKGFGFVEMESEEEANKAIEALNGKDFDGRSVVVSVARPKEDRPPRRDFGGGGGGGGGRDFNNRGGGSRGGYGGDR